MVSAKGGWCTHGLEQMIRLASMPARLPKLYDGGVSVWTETRTCKWLRTANNRYTAVVLGVSGRSDAV